MSEQVCTVQYVDFFYNLKSFRYGACMTTRPGTDNLSPPRGGITCYTVAYWAAVGRRRWGGSGSTEQKLVQSGLSVPASPLGLRDASRRRLASTEDTEFTRTVWFNPVGRMYSLWCIPKAWRVAWYVNHFSWLCFVAEADRLLWTLFSEGTGFLTQQNAKNLHLVQGSVICGHLSMSNSSNQSWWTHCLSLNL